MTLCAVCASADTGYLAEKNGYTFSQCNACGFIFLDPMPSQEELDAQYTDRHREAEPTYDKAGSRLRRAWMKLHRFYPYARNKDTLDLGCGGGFIAHVLGRIARTSTGVDISNNAISYAKSRFKKPVFECKSFPELLKNKNQYDFIYSSEVIEHVSDVNLFMRVLQHLAAPRAYVYLTTPDSGHPRVPAEISQWDVFTPPVHVQFFNKNSASVLFERYGFRIEKFYKNRKPGLIFLARKI
jgi:SAM-dependent methyltransferase